MDVEKIRFLTSMRGLAALFVAMFHWLFWMKDLQPWLDAHTSFFSRGYVWVDFFFVLSGFVLMHVYGRRLSGKLDWHEIKKFYVARFARIYPLYFFSLVCYLVFVLTLRAAGVEYEALQWGERFSAESFGTNLIMIQSLSLHKQLTWNMAAWSISAEFAVYLLIPLLVVALEHGLGRWLLLGTAAAIFYSFYQIQGDVNLTFDFGFVRCLSEVIAGMCLYKFGYQGGTHGQPGSPWLVFLLMALVLAGLHLPEALVEDAFIVAVFGMLIVTLSNARGNAFAWLEAPPLVWLGERSYSFYINHFLAGEIVYVLYSPNVGRRGDWHPSVASGALFLLLVLQLNLAVSALTYSWIEKPGRKWCRNKILAGQ